MSEIEDTDESGYAEWVRSDVTKFILKGCLTRMANLARELQSAAVGATPREGLAVLGGRVDELRTIIKTLSGGRAA